MTDSEDDLVSSNVYSFRNDRTTIQAKGPNYTNVSNFSCRNNFLTSTMHMQPRNFERRDINYDQRSLYYKRDTSPMSLRSVPNMRANNFHHPYNMGGIGSHRSVCNGRSCSPTSMRSIDTTASMSAAEIASAIKNENFNMYDLRLIKEACNKYLKSRFRKGIEKRRNHRLFLKSTKKSGGEDSGEQGSDSSISSDDCKSTRTMPCRDYNVSRYKTTKLNVTNIRMTINEGNMYKDCTENIRKNHLKNVVCNESMLSQNPKLSRTSKEISENHEKSLLIKDRFNKGYLLPSQRFHNSIAKPLLRVSKPSEHSYINKMNKQMPDKSLSDNLESEQEEIFSEITTIEKNPITGSNKRNIECEEINNNPQKKIKLPDNQTCKKKISQNVDQHNIGTEFEFAKPQLPARKSTNAKQKQISPEKLISKWNQPISNIFESSRVETSLKEAVTKKSNNIEADFCDKRAYDNETVANNLTSDASMRSSFIKRKLFTQKLDLAERKNASDTSQSSSPQIKNMVSNKEKNKTRKLATSQSCLSRDVLEEGSNFLDLIHRIVPAEQMSMTNVTNKTESKRYSQPDSKDNWDVSSVISTCNDQDVSDTYTDEEIFKINNICSNKSKGSEKPKVQSKLTANCKIVLQKLPMQQAKLAPSNVTFKQTIVNGAKGTIQKTPKVALKSFWDTDLESDLENCDKTYSNINTTVINNINLGKDKNNKKQQNHKVNRTPAITNNRSITIKNKLNSVNTKKTSDSDKTCKTVKGVKRKQCPKSKENKENNYDGNISNRSLRSNKSEQNVNETKKTMETAKAVTLISHHMGRPKRKIKPKVMNCIDCPSPRENISDSEFNISVKSLRSHQKNTSINENLISRNMKVRNRSGVKGI